MFRHPSLITAQVLGLVTPPLSLFHTLLQWKVCLASDSFDFVSCHCPLDFTDLFFRIWPSIFSWEVPCTRVPVLSEINTVPSWCLLPRSSAVVALQNPSALSYFLLSVCIWISRMYLDFRCPKLISLSPFFLLSRSSFVLCIFESRHHRLPRFPTKNIGIIVSPSSGHSAIYQKYLLFLPPVSSTFLCTHGGSATSLFYCRLSLAVSLHTSFEFAFLNISACLRLSIVSPKVRCIGMVT